MKQLETSIADRVVLDLGERLDSLSAQEMSQTNALANVVRAEGKSIRRPLRKLAEFTQEKLTPRETSLRQQIPLSQERLPQKAVAMRAPTAPQWPVRTPETASTTSVRQNPHDLLVEVQRAVGNVLAEHEVQDVESLNSEAFRQLSAAARLSFERNGLVIDAHNSSLELARDLRNPDFLSVTRKSDRSGWLVPSPRVLYADSYSLIFKGGGERWPSFVEPAGCQVDPNGKAGNISPGKS